MFMAAFAKPLLPAGRFISRKFNLKAMITQFQGEDRKGSIVNHFGLDIVEEDDFFEFIDEMGYSIDDSDDLIESLHKMFLERQS